MLKEQLRSKGMSVQISGFEMQKARRLEEHSWTLWPGPHKLRFASS